MEQQHPEFSEEELLNSITNNREGESCRYAFLLGAGASVSSNIPAAATMAKAWLDKLKEQNFSKYETIKALDGFDEENLAAFYPNIYKMKFGSVPQDGYQAIENYMSDNEVKPSIGYTILAQVLSRTSHNVVLTTNFDRLTETALLDFENIHARVIAHESMLNVVPVHDKKPSIIKVHRDMIFSPISTAEEIEELDKKWRPVIQTLFSRYHVIALGYGGNDGGLMSIITDVLKDNPQSRLFWCYRNQHADTLSSLLCENEMKDKIVPVAITGFDEFLYKLRHPLEFELYTSTFEKNAKIKEEAYQKQLEAVQSREKSSENTERKKAVEELFADTWWQVQAAVNETEDVEEKDRIYQVGIKRFPKSHELVGNYANFLHTISNDYDKAEVHYQKALTAEPNAANNNSNYANFLRNIRKDHDKAETHYKKALAEEPNDANINGNYASFLTDISKDHDKAEVHYQKALTAQPDHANNNGNYAIFLTDIRKDHDKAETHYQNALTAEPNDADFNGNYANFLTNIRKDHDKAEVHYQNALTAEPDHANNNGNYANFLKNISKDHDKAEVHYQKALTAEPDHANNNGNYADFLHTIRKDYNKAEEHYQKALAVEPENANNNGNYAIFLKEVRKDYDKAEEHYQRALAAEPNHANNNGNYAIFLENIRKDYDKAETHYQKALTAEPDHANNNGNYANFLTDIRKDYDKSEEHYQKALTAEPDDADFKGNYAKLLFVQGMKKRAEPYIVKAEQGCDNNESLALELAFYRLALFPESQGKSRKTITELLDKGVSSPGWDLSGIIAQAEHENCEYVDELKALAAKISAIN